jgi:hypothetical protein
MNMRTLGRASIASPIAALFAIVLFLSSTVPAGATEHACGTPGAPPCRRHCGVPGSPPCDVPMCGTPGGAPCASTLLDTYYDVNAGDNLVRLINPVGTTNRCAMIYVFDSNEEMGECCGCPLSPQKLLSLSVKNDLTLNWVFSPPSPQAGVIEIISALPNASTKGGLGSQCQQSGPACNGGCDPTNVPGFDSTSRQLKGYIVHNRSISATSGIPEVPFAEAGDPDSVTLNSLQDLCGAILGTGDTKIGVCNCGQ